MFGCAVPFTDASTPISADQNPESLRTMAVSETVASICQHMDMKFAAVDTKMTRMEDQLTRTDTRPDG